MKILKKLFIQVILLGIVIFPALPAAVGYAASSDACSSTTTGGKVDSKKVGACLDQSKAVKDIQKIVNILSAAVGVIIIIMIILGGVQYSMAGDNSSAVEAARKRIMNAIIALFAFLFAWAFVQWLIPGGIFGP